MDLSTFSWKKAISAAQNAIRSVAPKQQQYWDDLLQEVLLRVWRNVYLKNHYVTRQQYIRYAIDATRTLFGKKGSKKFKSRDVIPFDTVLDGWDETLHSNLTTDNKGTKSSSIRYTPSPPPQFEYLLTKDYLNLLSRLCEKDQNIIIAVINGETLQSYAKRQGMSKSWMSRCLQRAMERLNQLHGSYIS